MMRKFKNLLGESAPVATPYFIEDITPEIRMLVAQWVRSHEPYAKQFSSGKVDTRVVTKVAEFIATVNAQEKGDPSFNEGVKKPMRAIYPITKAAFSQMISVDGEPDHFVAFAKQMGQERFDSVIDALAVSYEKCEMLLHGDCHVQNILVEPMTETGDFGESGEFFMCDWEMVHHGVKGRDPGTFNAFPLLSACFFAAQGRKQEAYSMVDLMHLFWDSYSAHFIEKSGKDEAYLVDLYRSSVAWCGVYAFIANFMLKLQWDFMPFEKIGPEAGSKVLASLALAGVKCMEWGFLVLDAEYSLEDQRKWFADLVGSQIELLLEICRDL